MRAEDSNDKYKQLSTRYSQQIDRLRQLIDRNAGKDQLIDIEREKREKAQQTADRYRQLSERQMSQIDRVTKLLETQRQNKSIQMQKMREQLQISRAQTKLKIEQIVREKVKSTQETVRKQFQAEKMRLGNQIRNIKVQNQNIVNRVGDSKDEVNRLKDQIIEWQKRGDIYESTIMGLRVQINYLSAQRQASLSPSPQYHSPMRSARAFQAKSEISYKESASGRASARTNTANHSHSHSAAITSQFTDKQREKMLESYSQNLLKSIEKKASAQGSGGIDDRFKHLASNPVFTTFSSKFLKRSNYHSSGLFTPKLGGNRSNLNLFEKLSTPQKGRGLKSKMTNLFRSGGSGSVSKIQHPRPNTFNQNSSSSSAFDLGDHDFGTMHTGRFGRNNKMRQQNAKSQNNNEQNKEQIDEQLDDQNRNSKFITKRTVHVIEGIADSAGHLMHQDDQDDQEENPQPIIKRAVMDESADFPHLLKQQDDSEESQQESDFEIVKNKLVHIGDTSRILGKKADAAAEDIQSHRKTYQSNKDQDVFDRPPSVGDAEPSKDNSNKDQDE